MNNIFNNALPINDALLANKAHSIHIYSSQKKDHTLLVWITILTWSFFLLFIGKLIQLKQLLTLIQAYARNLCILFLDKIAYTFWMQTHHLIQ